MTTDTPGAPAAERFDLCIIGAGVAGLNALAVASEYLDRGARVLLVDRRDGVGGMWNSTYDHVRLHQPHPVFTAGDIEWQIDQPQGYLADRFEIVDHFRHCLATLRKKVTLVERFGHVYEGHDEVEVDGRYVARVRLRSVDGSATSTVETPRCIKATGFDVQPQPPMKLSSGQVRSIAPESPEFLGEAMRADGAPIYVVGGGKTGTDAAWHAVKKLPGRHVEMIVGRGRAFIDRAKIFPEGPVRYVGGTLILDMMRDLALRYDGDNDEAVFRHFEATYGLNLPGTANSCLFALISPEEIDVIAGGVKRVVNAHLEDVVDGDDGPVMVLGDGTRQPVEPGSWIVNCSGHLLKERSTYEPCISPKGTVLSIQQTAAITFVTTFGAYFLTHLWFLGKLPGLPLWVMNHEALEHANKQSYLMVASAQIVYNLIVIMGNAPPGVILRCGINFDNWYPRYRLLWMVAKLRLNRAGYLAHFEKALRRVEAKYGIQGHMLSDTPDGAAPGAAG